MLNVPGLNYGVIQRRRVVGPSGNVSIGGATGLENQYIVNGLNVTGSRYGNLEAGQASLGGGTNLPIEFLKRPDVNTGGYQAEYGGATGGVINTVLRNGSNEFHGSVFGAYAPYWLAADPKIVTTVGSSIAMRKPDFDDRIGFEARPPHQGQAVLLGRLRALDRGEPRAPPDVRPRHGHGRRPDGDVPAQ